jgi:tetratricopeptide (TPR) repeat protein
LTLQKSSYNIPRWFTEGISTWEEEDPQSEVDRQLKWAWKNQRLLPLEDINSGFSQQSYPNQIGVSYYHASLVCKYINDKYGYKAIQEMLRLYREGKGNEEAIEGGTGRKISEINKEVKAYVDEYVRKIPISVPMEKKDMADLEATLKSFGLKGEKELDLAAAYVNHGENAKARAMVDEILKKNPKSARAFAIDAFIHYRKKDLKKAKKSFEKVVSIEPLHYGANFFLGKFAEDDKDWEASIGYYQKALEYYPRVENQANNLYFKIVTMYDTLKNKEGALKTLRLHTENNNKNFTGFVKYADRLKEHGENIKAIEAYKNAIYIYPFDLRVHVECGGLLVAEKQFKEALLEYKVALELESRDKDVLKKIFNVYIEITDYTEAEAILKRFKRVHPEEDISALEKKLP